MTKVKIHEKESKIIKMLSKSFGDFPGREIELIREK